MTNEHTTTINKEKRHKMNNKAGGKI